MIDSAIVLLARDGYQATSFSGVLAASGAPRGSIYHHFPEGKDELVAAAIRTQAERVFDGLGRLSGQPPEIIAASFLDGWRRMLVATDFAVGCSLTAVTVSAGPGALREQTGEVFRDWRGLLARLLTDAGVPVDPAGAFGAQLLAAAEGAVVIARAEHSLEAFELVAARLVADAARLLDPPPPALRTAADFREDES